MKLLISIKAGDAALEHVSLLLMPSIEKEHDQSSGASYKVGHVFLILRRLVVPDLLSPPVGQLQTGINLTNTYLPPNWGQERINIPKVPYILNGT